MVHGAVVAGTGLSRKIKTLSFEKYHQYKITNSFLLKKIIFFKIKFKSKFKRKIVIINVFTLYLSAGGNMSVKKV